MNPIMIIVYLAAGAVGILGWTFVLGNVIFALGFTGASFVLVKWARKKWLPGVMAILIVIATLVIAYAWFVGAFAT